MNSGTQVWRGGGLLAGAALLLRNAFALPWRKSGHVNGPVSGGPGPEAGAPDLPRLLLRHTLHYLAFIDCNYVYREVSDPYEKLLDRPREAIVGHTVAEVWGRERFEKLMRHAIDEAFASGDACREGWVDVPGAGPRYFCVNYQACRQRDGSVSGVVASAKDITDIKRSEQALLEKDQRYRSVMRATTDVVWDWDLVTGKVTWNENLHAVFGLDESAMASGPQPWYDHLHPEDRDRVIKGIHSVIDSGAESWADEYRFLRADGSIAHVFDRGYVTRDVAGRPVRMVGAMMDITERKHTEAEQLALAVRDQALVQALGEIVYESRPRANVVTWEGDFTRILGYSREEIGTTHESWTQRVHPDDMAQVQAALRESQLTRKLLDVDYRFLHKDGSYIWMHDRAKLFHDESGDLERVIGVFSDISLRKRAEERLRASEQNYRTLYDDSPSMFFTIGPDWNLLSVNEFGASQLGYPVEELEGRAMDLLYPDSDWEASREHLAYALVHPGDLQEWEARWKCKTGRMMWVRATARAIDSPGGERLILLICRDITFGKEASIKLQQSEERLKLALDAMDGGVWDWNLQTGEVFRSDKWRSILGYPSSEYQPSLAAWQALIHADDRERVMRNVQDHLDGKSTAVSVQYRLRPRQGDWIWLESWGMVVERAADGQPLRMAGVALDITKRKLVEDALAVKVKQVEFIGELTRMFVGDRDLDEIFSFMVQGVASILNVEFAKILELAPPGEVLVLRAGVGWRAGLVGEAVVPARSNSQAGYTLAAGEPVVVMNLASESRFEVPDLLVSHGVVSGVSVAIGEVSSPFGVFAVHSCAQREFQKEDVEFMQNVANVVAEIIRAKRTDGFILQSRERLRNLATRLHRVREEERTIMAREIHDELGQTMTGLRIDLAWMMERLPKRRDDLAERARSALLLVDEALDTVRRMAHDLRPAMLDDLGLEAAIEWQVEEFSRRTGCRTRLEMEAGNIGLDNERDTVVFRILQEALTNVSRHAAAQTVRISLRAPDDNLILEIADDGRGISEEAIRSSHSIGLIGMRERAGSMGGRILISKKRGGGTTIHMEMPLHQS